MKRILRWMGWGNLRRADGQFRETAFALHAALRPWMWGEVMKLGRNSAKALRSLGEALHAEID